jgi:hypothetical protein
MTQRFSIGLVANVVYTLGVFRRPISAALVLAVAVIGLLVTAAATPLAPSLSTVMESTWSQLPAADRANRANQDDYLERLVEALDHDS